MIYAIRGKHRFRPQLRINTNSAYCHGGSQWETAFDVRRNGTLVFGGSQCLCVASVAEQIQHYKEHLINQGWSFENVDEART